MVKIAARTFGHGVSLVILGLFIYFSFKLWGMSQDYLISAGGLAEKNLVLAMVDNPLSGLLYIFQGFTADGGLTRLLNYALSWICIVGSVGSTWMSILGIRSIYWSLVSELR